MCARNKIMLLEETCRENALKNFDSSVSRPRMDKKIIKPTKKKLSCWDQNRMSMFMLVCEMNLLIKAVIGSVDPVLRNIVLIRAYGT